MKKAFSISFFVIGLVALVSVAVSNARMHHRFSLDPGNFEYIWMENYPTGTFNSDRLFEIAISPNPYESQNLIDPETFMPAYKKEESLRVLALQSLQWAIVRNEASPLLIERIAKQASSTTVRRIANRMYEFSKSKEGDTNLFEQAVMDLDFPR